MLIKGNGISDNRGIVTYNNGFDASEIKRIYSIENVNTNFKRGWQGHRIEQRWFACLHGGFRIYTIHTDNFENPSSALVPECYELSSETLDILHVPAGHFTMIQSMEEASRLLVMSDYLMGSIQDEYRLPDDYFKFLL